ncbi:MAG: metalloregulator ArsR/SmtB family transcription factor [Bacteroidales bacterium]|nr:metalloregulator ArsR/SmtB family transcription factor [Bacteroidales bacterium]MDD4602276.1 metalloregulator ArsR/SmtB family transcription factor [Bacteroidales bacterium]
MKKNAILDIQKLETAASKLRAIAHPMRIAIIELLTNNKQLTVTEIYERLNIEQASASHHLNILKNKGLLASKRNGKMIYYSLKMEALSNIIDCINQCASS